MELFKKSVIVGVSVTPEVGLEVAQIDMASQTVLKYGVRPLDYDINRRDIADVDIFKETFQELFFELQIPKGAAIVLNIPTVTFKVNDYPAALDEEQITNAIDEELAEIPYYKNSEPATSATLLPNSNIQFNKIAYKKTKKNTLIEISQAIKDLGYKIYAIDESVNSILRALILKERVNVEPDVSWVLMIVETFCCRVISMIGRNFVDSFEEKISIGEVLGDAENYSTVISAVSPLLKNLPAKYLCVVSKTNVISAEVLASKLTYSAPIIHQEANSYSKEAFMDLAPDIDESLAPVVSLDIIGAAIYKDFEPLTSVHFNLFNKTLGDIWVSEQPPEITLGGKTYVLSLENLIKALIVIAILTIVPTLIGFIYLSSTIKSQKAKMESLDSDIASIQKFLDENKNISADLFDEGFEIRAGLEHNKNIYSYYTIVGTEIPKKLWLTHLKLSDKTTIEGQADNLESVYAFFRSIKDYNTNSEIKLQKLGLAASSKLQAIDNLEGLDGQSQEFDTDSILTSMNADFYEFRISDEPEVSKDDLKKDGNTDGNASAGALPDIEDIK